MKHHVKDIAYADSRKGKHGTLHAFKMTVILQGDDAGMSAGDQIRGFYQTNDQGVQNYQKGEDGLPTAKDLVSKKFTAGQDALMTITVEKSTKTGKDWYKIRPEREMKGARYNQNLRREQARYSSFAYAYTKDLIVAGKLELDQWDEIAKKAALGMLEIDKELSDD